MTRYHKGERLHYTPFYGAYSKRCVVLAVHRNRAERYSWGSTTPPGDHTLYLLDCGNERVWSTSTYLSHEPYESNEELIEESQMFEKGDVIYHLTNDRYGIITKVKTIHKPLRWSSGKEVHYQYEMMIGLEKRVFTRRIREWEYVVKADAVV